eukprot:5303360-Lingulodinium_polyedra.AAC.1
MADVRFPTLEQQSIHYTTAGLHRNMLGSIRSRPGLPRPPPGEPDDWLDAWPSSMSFLGGFSWHPGSCIARLAAAPSTHLHPALAAARHRSV